MTRSKAEIVREYPVAGSVHGVTFDGADVWFASDEGLTSFDPASGETKRTFAVRAPAGTAFDGRHLYQVTPEAILRLDPTTGEELGRVPSPGEDAAGLTWAEGSLWVSLHRGRKILRIDPKTGEVLRTITSNRNVTGVTFVDAELWHGTWDGDESELRRVDAESGEVRETIEMPPGVGVTGLEHDGHETFFCGGGKSGKVRAVRRPAAKRRAG